MPVKTKAVKPEKAKREKPKPVKIKKAAIPAAGKQKPGMGKVDIILTLLSRIKGANITQLQEATGWQPHSIRAVISGLRKKGMTIERSQAKDGTTLYRVEKA